MGNPFPLKQNEGKSFQGSIVLGKGFVLSKEKAAELIAKDPRNKDVLFPYLNGDDLNNDPEQKPSRWVINFFDWDEGKAMSYPDCYKIVESLVKPERQRWLLDKNGSEVVGTYALRKPLPQKWWIYGEKRPALYSTISQLDQVMTISEVTKYVSFGLAPVNIVFMHTVKVIAWSGWDKVALLNSSLYCEWSWKYASTMGGGTLRYTPSSCFDTFPFINELSKENEAYLSEAGKKFYKCRKKLMEELKLGVTKTYNFLHNKEIRNIEENDLLIDDTTFSKKYGKEAAEFKKHLRKLNFTDYNSFVDRLEELRSVIVEINEILLRLYGWSDIQLQHDFYDLDYLPENDRTRFTIHPDIRKEVLKRLLKLNHQIHANESATENRTKNNYKKKGKKNTDDITPTLFS